MSFFDELQAATTLEREHLLHTPIIQDALRGRIDLAQYVAFLTEAYHHVRHTVPLLMACGSRLSRDRAWLRDAVAHYIADETGHDEWILADIAACGSDADSVRRGRAGFDTEVMIRFAYHQIDRCNPIGFLGMVHVLEGTSAAIATAASESIRTSLKLPREAFSYLASHGSLDIEHTRFFESLVNRLTHPDDRAVTIACARDFYRLYGNVFRSLPSEAKAAA